MCSTLRDVMEPVRVTIAREVPWRDAFALLLDQGEPHLYVTESSGLLHGLLPDVTLLKNQMQNTNDRVTVGDLLTTNVPKCCPQLTLSEALPTFRESRFREAAIVEAGFLLGVVRRPVLLKELFTRSPRLVPRPKFVAATIRLRNVN